MNLLLDAHQHQLNPKKLIANEGDVLFHQSDFEEILMLPTLDCIAVNVHHGTEFHTMAEVEAVELLGEIGFFRQ